VNITSLDSIVKHKTVNETVTMWIIPRKFQGLSITQSLKRTERHYFTDEHKWGGGIKMSLIILVKKKLQMKIQLSNQLGTFNINKQPKIPPIDILKKPTWTSSYCVSLI
jgi:hypothetical protein